MYWETSKRHVQKGPGFESATYKIYDLDFSISVFSSESKRDSDAHFKGLIAD